jgi:hypothetical protein
MNYLLNMSARVRILLLIVAGIVLCLAFQIASNTYRQNIAPSGTVKNADFNLVQIRSNYGDHICDLRKGEESKPLGYGAYKVTIVDSGMTFSIWKNSSGSCSLHSEGGILILETDGNCGVGDKQY